MAAVTENPTTPRRITDLLAVRKMLRPLGTAAARMRCLAELMILGINDCGYTIFTEEGMADGSPIILTIQRPPTPSNVIELFITEANVPQLERFLKSSAVASELWTVSFMIAAAPLFAASVVTSVAKEMGCTVENEVHRQIFLTPEQLPASPTLSGVTMQPLDETHIPKLLSRWPYSSVVTDAAKLVLRPVRAGLSMGVFGKTQEHIQRAGREQSSFQRDRQLHDKPGHQNFTGQDEDCNQHDEHHTEEQCDQQDLQQHHQQERHHHDQHDRLHSEHDQDHNQQDRSRDQQDGISPSTYPGKPDECLQSDANLRTNPASFSENDDKNTPPPPPDKLLAWMVLKRSGDAGFLWTEEQFRGRGYGSAVLVELCRLCIKRGLQPCVGTNVDNKTTQCMLKKHGFRYLYTGSFFDVSPKDGSG